MRPAWQGPAEHQEAADPEEREGAEEHRRRWFARSGRAERGRRPNDGAVGVHHPLGQGARPRRVDDRRQVGRHHAALDRRRAARHRELVEGSPAIGHHDGPTAGRVGPVTQIDAEVGKLGTEELPVSVPPPARVPTSSMKAADVPAQQRGRAEEHAPRRRCEARCAARPGRRWWRRASLAHRCGWPPARSRPTRRRRCRRARPGSPCRSRQASIVFGQRPAKPDRPRRRWPAAPGSTMKSRSPYRRAARLMQRPSVAL